MPLTVVGDFRRIRPFLRWTSTALYEKGVVARLARQVPTSGDHVTMVDNGRFDYMASDGTALRDASLAELLPLLVERHAAPVARSQVVEEGSGPNEYRALVDAAGGDEQLLLKASHHPGWKAWLDGLPTEIAHAAPNLMAISVPPGRHEVRFRYRNPAYQKLLFAGSLGAVLAWAGYAAMRVRAHARRTSA